MLRKVLLVCGILASAVYVAGDIIAAWLDEGYSYAAQSVSELSAIGAPTRPFMVTMLLISTLLVIAFGVGVWQAAGGRRGLRASGGFLIAIGAVGLAGPLMPMHMRGVPSPAGGLAQTDVLHIASTVFTVAFILLAIGFGATAFGKGWRWYSIATIALMILGGAIAGFDGPRLAAGLPTPWMGVTERINIYAYLLWLAVLSVALLRAERAAAQESLGEPGIAGGVGSLPAH